MSTNADQPTHTPAPSVPGKIAAGHTFGKYRIVRGVAVGGMAQVFLASRDGPDGFAKPYVIKRILPEYARDERFIKLFVNEAKVAAMLDHPNIVHVFDFELEHGDYYLVMEFVAGASISSITRANQKRGVPLGAVVAVEIGAAIADALSYAHDLKLPDGRPLDLVHRDISPGNVIVSHDGAVKLADFGVVKTSMTATVVGVVNGKWAYMSPEEICGQSVDRRSDLFSLGTVLHEVITGVPLFRGNSAADTASRVMGAKVRHPKALVPDLDPRLDEIIMKLLDRDVEARYQTAAELAVDLHALRASPAFSAGATHLRGLIRTLFPDRTSTPALGASMSAGSRLSPVEPHAVVGPANDEAPRAVTPFEGPRFNSPPRAVTPFEGRRFNLNAVGTGELGSTGPSAFEGLRFGDVMAGEIGPAVSYAGGRGSFEAPRSSDMGFDAAPAAPAEGGVSRGLIFAIVAACLVGSVVFWLILF